jgi:hypothetical protein
MYLDVYRCSITRLIRENNHSHYLIVYSVQYDLDLWISPYQPLCKEYSILFVVVYVTCVTGSRRAHELIQINQLTLPL